MKIQAKKITTKKQTGNLRLAREVLDTSKYCRRAGEQVLGPLPPEPRNGGKQGELSTFIPNNLQPTVGRVPSMYSGNKETLKSQ